MKQERIFKTKLIPGKEGSDNLFDEEYVAATSGPVICLGLTFENDEARRTHFTEELRKRLEDTEFRKIEGFPLGEDEDILKLSDPPYYTACPNPWIADFVAEWEGEKPAKPDGYQYHREPFAADVSEGKNDPIYNAHSYHTKVPHKAIMRYILHYTDPGDIVFDGFCGTGMTGLAAQLCGSRNTIMSLGYQVQADGIILREETNEDSQKVWKPFSKLGVRKAVLNDLSPAATFIAYNYNTPLDVVAFEIVAKRIINEVKQEYGWMYQTYHTDETTKGIINFTVWSDIFICSECTGEINFWQDGVDKTAGSVSDTFNCPHCSASLVKKNLDRVWLAHYDETLKKSVRFAKQIPVLINYSVNGKRYEKEPDDNDITVINRVDKEMLRYWFPSTALPEGSNTSQPARSHGITHVHQFYTKRNLIILSAVLDRLKRTHPRHKAWFTSTMSWVGRELRLHLSNYFGGGGGVITSLRGTLYVASLSVETNVLERLGLRIRWQKFRQNNIESATIQETCGAANSTATDNSCDYIFLDPPFGSNLNYSELNSLLEGWLGVSTNNQPEAIENRVQKKGLPEYRVLMTECFRKAYQTLKPGRWMTVEFSNTKASVWNNIQTALMDAGFIVANVSALDKKKGSFKACTTPTAVKQDLVLSAYKPNGGFEERFQQEAKTEEGVWDFIRTHLKYLAVIKGDGPILQFVPERDPRILFDQVVTYYVRKGHQVPVSSQDFQVGLAQRFIERDGMYFLPDQVSEYDRKKMTAVQLTQESLFVSDESSAILWLRQLLSEKPQTFSSINPQFMQQLGGWSKNESQLDLRELLDQNFLSFDGRGAVPTQVSNYLSKNWKEFRGIKDKDDPALVKKAHDRWYVPDPNKAGDLEKLREKALLREFETYKEVKKKLKVFRLEAIRAGFNKAWHEHDYTVIIEVAEKIPNKVLEEDAKLLMWYDQAVTRMGDE